MFPCFKCDSSFSEGKSLVCHVRILHSIENIQVFKCRYKKCIREFDKLKSFEKHLAIHKRREDEPSCSKETTVIDADISNSGTVSESQSETNVESGPFVQDNETSTVLYFNAVTNAVSKFVAKLYQKDTLTRSQIQEIVEEVKGLFCTSFFALLKDSVMQALQESETEKLGNIRCLFDILGGAFDDFDTEWKRMKFLSEQNAFITPQQYSVGTADVQKSVQGQIIAQPTLLTGSFTSPGEILKRFLEIPGVLGQIISYMNDIDNESDVMENLVQGSLWKDVIKPKFGNKLVLPLNMSFDDLETNKDLGSHATVHKLSACHINIASLPPIFQSSLDNSFLTLLYHSSDKAFGLAEVFRPLLEELKLLEEQGIEVTVNDTPQRIYFALCLIIGDNLGLNTIHGMVESFSANYFCRICKVHKDATRSLIRERSDLLRTEVNYENDVERDDYTSTGVKSKSIWNELSSFNFTVNIYADIMHDIMEGIGDYDMCFIIQSMVKKKWLTYDELNDLVQGFYYGQLELGNKPPLICEHKVKDESLGFSASEMLCLIRFFPLMVGHRAEEEDPVWKFFLCLRELIDILFAPAFSRSCLSLLSEMIAEHHSAYMSLSKRHLRPKYHMAIHYARIIEKVGPLKPIWAMRSEAKYKELRQAAHVTSCRKNISLTLMTKANLKLCARFLGGKGLEHKFAFSPSCERIRVRDLGNYEAIAHKLPLASDDDKHWNVVKWVIVDGTKYTPGMVVILEVDDFFPKFGSIHVISVTERSEARFLVKGLVTFGFNSHLHSYHVKDDTSRDCWAFVKQTDLVTHTPAHKRYFFDGECYVTLRYAL